MSSSNFELSESAHRFCTELGEAQGLIIAQLLDDVILATYGGNPNELTPQDVFKSWELVQRYAENLGLSATNYFSAYCDGARQASKSQANTIEDLYKDYFNFIRTN